MRNKLKRPFVAGVVGPYLMHNFGDDLIGAVIAKSLEARGAKRVYMHNIDPDNAGVESVAIARWKLIPFLSDVVVIGGGHILGDGAARPGTYYHRQMAHVAFWRSLMRRPTVILGVGAGPMVRALSRWSSGFAVKRCKAIGVRDPASAAHVVEVMGVKRDRVFQGADLAMLWPLLFPAWLPKEQPTKRVLGIQLDPTDSVGDDIASAVRQHAASYDEVVYFSTGTHRTKAVEAIGTPGREVFYERLGDYLPELVSCDALISTHLHIAIAAYAAGVPTASFAVNSKTTRFYDQADRSSRCCSYAEAKGERPAEVLEQLGLDDSKSADERTRKQLQQAAQRVTDQTLDAVLQ